VQLVAWKIGKGRDTVRRTVSVGRDWSSVTTAIETPLIRDRGLPRVAMLVYVDYKQRVHPHRVSQGVGKGRRRSATTG
jgi:hypothetical protein